MSVIVTLRWPDVRPEQYDELRDVVGWETEPAPGGLFHCAAFDEAGIRVTDVWETAEQFETFVATRLMPGVHKIGVLGEPTVEIHPAHAVFAPAYRSGPGAAAPGLEKNIRRMFEEVVNKGDLGLVDELFAPEFVSHNGAQDMDLAAFKGFVADWRASCSDIHCAVENVLVDGDRVAWTVRATGTNDGPMMGMPPTDRKIDFLSINEGRANADGTFAEHWVVMDTVAMLQQLGVMPAAPAG
jgi:predicted ester cyclase